MEGNRCQWSQPFRKGSPPTAAKGTTRALVFAAIRTKSGWSFQISLYSSPLSLLTCTPCTNFQGVNFMKTSMTYAPCSSAHIPCITGSSAAAKPCSMHTCTIPALSQSYLQHLALVRPPTPARYALGVRARLAATAREEQHRLARLQQPKGRARRGLDRAKALKQRALRALPVRRVREAPHLPPPRQSIYQQSGRCA